MVPTHCKICCCNMPNRCKHCYKCGRCVLKYDHHCPWIGACVGEYNHCKFWFMLLCHTCQAIFGMIIVKCMYYIVFTIDDDVLI